MPTKRTSQDAQYRSDSGTAPAKRRRVLRACDQCRAAREKCDGAQPPCAACLAQSRTCTYDANVKKRGVQTGYIRTLELALAWVSERVPGSEDALESLLSRDSSQGQSPLGGRDSLAGERLHRVWRKSKTCKTIEKALSGSDAPSQPEGSDKATPLQHTDGESEGEPAGLAQSSDAGQSQADDGITADDLDAAQPNPARAGNVARSTFVTEYVDFLSQLRHAINRQTFCGGYALSGNDNEQEIPSAYVLRILFLWAGSLLDPSPGSKPSQLLQTIERYLEQFGPCSAPPFLVSCMAILRCRQGFNDLLSDEQQRWDRIAATLSRTWDLPPIDGRIRQDEPSKSPLSQVRLPPNHWRLLDVYWGYTHSWLPILEKQEILKTVHLYHGHSQSLSPEDRQTAPHAELWAALALASFQEAASRRPETAESTQGASAAPLDRSVAAHGSGEPQQSLTAQDIYDVARKLIPSEDGPFQVHHVRALIFLTLINLGKGNLTASWILMGLANRIAFKLGQAPPQRNQQHPGEPPPVARSVVMGCYILDIITCLICNGAPTWRPEDVENDPPLSEDGLAEWERWIPCDGFGVTATTAHPSRSPAFALSTMNQISNVFKVIGRYLATTKASSELPTATGPTPVYRPPSLSAQVTSTPTASAAPTPALSMLAPSSANFFNSPATVPLPQSDQYWMNDPSYMGRSSYQLPAKPLSSPINTRPLPHATSSTSVVQSSNAVGVQGASNLSESHIAQPGLLPLSGFNDAIDYEALLEDLSSIDCADRVEFDPQFMMNLGFAPGSDMTEIMTQEFRAG